MIAAMLAPSVQRYIAPDWLPFVYVSFPVALIAFGVVLFTTRRRPQP
jgi:hypothetical protein